MEQISPDQRNKKFEVEGVVEEFKDDFTETKDGAIKMITLMKKDWEKIKKALV